MAALYELLSVLIGSFLLNIIPFAGPSNLFIASNAALFVEESPIVLGVLVALGSVSAKFIHYLVTFFLRGFIGENRRKRVDASGVKVKRWAFLALFVVAASPIPDEPVVVPLGLMRYNPAKFVLAYFLGKVSITILGAYMGKLSQALFAPWISEEIFIAASIILTIVVTIVLLKVDVTKIAHKIINRKVSTP